MADNMLSDQHVKDKQLWQSERIFRDYKQTIRERAEDLASRN